MNSNLSSSQQLAGRPQSVKTSQPLKPVLPTGTFAGRYEIVSKIGVGGMAAIYKVRDLVIGEELAIKLIRPELATNDISHKRFRQEARAARDLNHPHIVSVRTFDISPDGMPFMIMDYIDGIDLGKVIRKSGPLNRNLFFPVFTQVTGALVHAHSRGVVHRDLKPSNILATTNKEGQIWVKLVDFGIAKLLYPTDTNEETHVLTKPGQTVGSPSYMSPEQVQGKAVDHRSDIYSLGCVMFEALSAQLPFKADSALQLAMHHVYSPPINLRQIVPDCPSGIEKIVAHCLEKRPENRYQSMFDVRMDLQLVEQGKEPLLRTGKTESGLLKGDDWFDAIRRDSSKEFSRILMGELSFDVRLNSVLEQIHDLGYQGDSILKLQSNNPLFTGLLIIRDGRQVIGARIQGERTIVGYEALRKIISMANGQFQYFTVQSDDYSLPDASIQLNLKYILSVYPHLPEASPMADDHNALRDLLFRVESDTRTDWQDDHTPVDQLLSQLDNRDERWRPVASIKVDTPASIDFVTRTELVMALEAEALLHKTPAQKLTPLQKVLKKCLKSGGPVVLIVVFLTAMMSMGTVIIKATMSQMSAHPHVRRKRPAKRFRHHSTLPSDSTNPTNTTML